MLSKAFDMSSNTLMSEKTPTKPVRRRSRGRKPKKETDASDFCCVCKNKGTYISSEILFTTSKDGAPLTKIVTERKLCTQEMHSRNVRRKYVKNMEDFKPLNAACNGQEVKSVCCGFPWCLNLSCGKELPCQTTVS